jgi:hypothetical protein
MHNPTKQASTIMFFIHFTILFIPKANLSVYSHVPLRLTQQYYPLTSYTTEGLKNTKYYAINGLISESAEQRMAEH